MTYITLLESSLISSNQVVNGGMEVWQRGNSFVNPGASAYTTDRWQMNHNGTPVLTVTKETSITDGSPSSFKWNMSGVGTGTVFRMRQTVEQANQLAGKTVTFTARVRVDSGGGGYVFVDMNDNNGSTPFNAWNATTLSGAATWETIYVTRTLASNVTTLNVQFNFNNTPGVCYIDNVTLVVGSQPMSYVPMQPQQELALCQRYFQVLGGSVNTYIGVGQADTTTHVGSSMVLPVWMRTTPTITINTPTGILLSSASGANIAVTTATGSSVSSHNLSLSMNVASGLTVGQASAVNLQTATVYISADY